MAVRMLCEKEMLEGSGCLPSKLRWIPKRGRVVDYERIRNGEEKRYGAVEPDRCHDCSVMPITSLPNQAAFHEKVGVVKRAESKTFSEPSHILPGEIEQMNRMR